MLVFGLSAMEVALPIEHAEINAVVELVRQAGGAPLGAYREPLGGRPLLLASLPFLAAFVGVLCSGFFSDWLIRRGTSVGFARKLPIIGGLLISTSIIGANFVVSTPLVIAVLALVWVLLVNVVLLLED